jgi:hypothetical protein|uniref:Uncharacterized protein n=1 Tax=Heterosigma akashiwo TaxID=2829 RepID=B2XT50_HETAK|nr:hypothetical protein Heak293_Cp041 [Heterosigma akashiwo]ABV65948.1 hypothetical protein Heak293_Cp041 [Heterosigma akashiwo]BBA18161.1 hypothetical protein [Heterosigma akashiwo]
MYSVAEFIYLTTYYVDLFREAVSYKLVNFLSQTASDGSSSGFEILKNRYGITNIINFYNTYWPGFWNLVVHNTLQTPDGQRYTYALHKIVKIYQLVWTFRSMFAAIPQVNPHTGIMGWCSFVLDWILQPITRYGQVRVPFVDFTHFFVAIVLNFFELVTFTLMSIAYDL